MGAGERMRQREEELWKHETDIELRFGGEGGASMKKKHEARTPGYVSAGIAMLQFV